MLELHDYQVVASEFIKNVKRSALYLDPGLGKTAITLSAIDESWFPILVIAPKRVATMTWPTEIQKWRPDLDFVVAEGASIDRLAILQQRHDITTIGRDVARDAIRRKYSMRIPTWKTLIVDESSGIKNRDSGRWRVANTLAKRADRVILLSGTPAPNGLMDLWAQIHVLDGGERLCHTITEFRARHYFPAGFRPNGAVSHWELHEGMDKKIHSKVEDIALGMQAKYRLDLPETTFNEISIPLPPKAREAYEKMRHELIVDFEDVFGGEVHTAANAAVLSSKLSQIASGAIYHDADSELAGTYQKIHTAKIDALKEIVGEVQGSPIVVFYRFQFERDAIFETFPEAMGINDKRFNQADWDAKKIPILVAHPASAAHGLNLQYGSNTMVWTSPTWELELWEQGIARLARQGQTEPVVIHSLITEKSVDRKVMARLRSKADVQDTFREAIESPV